ncbi:ComEC/Rec2 family competence protein [Clostridium sp.]|uniref:ComEC/Rec2 family competence protein n=1 Tax=Clostridium sp. TaxID=1506 RepID=UPI002FC891B6
MDRPLVYLFSGMFLGITSCAVFVYFNLLSSLIITFLYIIVIYKTTNYKVVYIIMCYFVLGIVSFNLYFNGDTPDRLMKVRLTEDKGYYVIAKYNGRKLKLININKEYEIGKNYIVKGDFKKVPLYQKGIIGNFTVKELTKLNNDIIGITYEIKKELYEKFNEKLGDYNASILMGVCYGDSSYISYEDKEAFNTLGISHVISVSGLHTSLIYSAISGILGYQLSLFLLFIYVIFTGAKAATVRAFIMIIVLVLSNKTWKNYDNISALSFAAFILLIFSPYYILDAGYLLSFLGMLGIYLLYEKLRRKLYKLPIVLNNSISLTIAASVFTIPYIIFIFNTFSIGSLLSNLIIIPFYTFVVVVGNVALFVYKVEPIFNFLCTILISIFSIIKGSQDFLLYLLPIPLNLSYIEGMVVVLLYPTYLLIKRGYKSLIYMPIALCFFVIVNYYKIFPQVSFINGGEYNIISVNYKWSTFLISPQKVKLNRIYENINVNKIYDEFYKEEKIYLDNKYYFKVYVDNKELVLFLHNENNNIVFLQETFYDNTKEKNLGQRVSVEYPLDNTEVFNKAQRKGDTEEKIFSRSNNYPYDIIKVIKNKDIHEKGQYIKSFNIINGAAYETYIH